MLTTWGVRVHMRERVCARSCRLFALFPACASGSGRVLVSRRTHFAWVSSVCTSLYMPVMSSLLLWFAVLGTSSAHRHPKVFNKWIQMRCVVLLALSNASSSGMALSVKRVSLSVTLRTHSPKNIVLQCKSFVDYCILSQFFNCHLLRFSKWHFLI